MEDDVCHTNADVRGAQFVPVLSQMNEICESVEHVGKQNYSELVHQLNKVAESRRHRSVPNQNEDHGERNSYFDKDLKPKLFLKEEQATSKNRSSEEVDELESKDAPLVLPADLKVCAIKNCSIFRLERISIPERTTEAEVDQEIDR